MRWFRIVISIFLLSLSFAPYSPSVFAAQPSDNNTLQRLDAFEEQLRLIQKNHQQALDNMNQRLEDLKNNENTPSRTNNTEHNSLDQRVEELEDQTVNLEADLDSMTQSLQDRVHLNLYATLEFESFQHTKPVFDARNIELFADVSLANRLRVFAEIEFERTAKTSGGNRQGDVEVEQGWMEFRIHEMFKPRAGVILVPFGRFNLEHFDPVRDLTARPIAMRRVVPVTWAEAGAGFVGNAFVGNHLSNTWLKDLTFDYQFFVVNGLTSRLSDTSTRNARGAFGSDNNANKATVGRLQTTIVSGVELGVSGYWGNYDAQDHSIRGLDTDWKFVFGPIEVIGEYAWLWLEKGGVENGSPAISVPRTLQGGYLQANYHFWFNGLNETFLGQGFSSPTFTGVIRYGRARIADDGDMGSRPNKESRWTFGLNYRPVENFVVKMEYQINNATNEALERGDFNGFLTSVTAAF